MPFAVPAAPTSTLATGPSGSANHTSHPHRRHEPRLKMPQTTLEILRGYMKLTADTLTQRYVNRNVPSDPLLSGGEKTLHGQTAIVTGANTGLGLETVRMLARAGATVIMACRNAEKAQIAADDIRRTIPDAKLHLSTIDLSSNGSIRSFCHRFINDTSTPLHMLVLNGGVMGVRQTSPETHFMVNHVGHFLLTMLLLPNMAPDARVVLVSSLTYLVSDLHLDDLAFEQRKYDWMTAYANSKLCMILFMKALKQRLRNSSITVNAVHPGEATSDVARNLGFVWMMLHKRVGALFLLSPAESARTSVYVAGAPQLAGVSGCVFHRVTEVLQVPETLVRAADVEKLWDVSIKFAGMSEPEVETLIHSVRQRS